MSVPDLNLRCPKYAFVAGIDEAGRGPLAGPVVASAVVLPSDCFIEGLTDSKRLSERRREILFNLIAKEATAWAVDFVFEDTIDKINIKQATHLAMERALDALTVRPNYLLVDGNDNLPFGVDDEYEYEYIIKGDFLYQPISAASIMAKVTRDRYMKKIHKYYPEYGFAQNKGYGTQSHIDAIRRYGLCSFHRKTFITDRVAPL